MDAYTVDMAAMCQLKHYFIVYEELNEYTNVWLFNYYYFVCYQ